MPHALRISSEMLMLDCDGLSPGFCESAAGGGGGGAAVGPLAGGAAGGGGSEAQPDAMATMEERTIAAAYFIASSLARPLSWAALGIPRLPFRLGRRETHLARFGNAVG